MDVVYDMVEGANIFIPIVAVIFICVTVFLFGRRQGDEFLDAGSVSEEPRKSKEEKKEKKKGS